MSSRIQSLRSHDDETIQKMLEYADPITLRGLLYHATGDADVAATRVEEVQWPFSIARNVTDPDDIALLRRKAFELLKAYADGTATPPGPDVTPRLLDAIALAAGEDLSPDDMQMHVDMLALDPSPRGWESDPADHVVKDFSVIVIGAGLAGINAAIQLKASNIPYVLLDKNDGVGGTWYQNTYPGARVDWPSVLYSHSYGVDFAFRYAFAPQKHNEEYLNWCVDQNGIRKDIRLKTRVVRMQWDEPAGEWAVTTQEADGSEGTYRANAIITAIGLLERPFVPQIPGMESFRGKIFHTTRFDHSIDYSDKRVVVVGTGASGMQMVPELADIAGEVTVLQRTPSWVFPAQGYRDQLPESLQWLNRNVPGYSNWTRFVFSWNLGDYGLYDQFVVDPDWPAPESVNANNHILRERLLAHMHARLEGRPDLIAKCTPDYPVFGTRPVIDNSWFDTLRSDKVHLVAAGAERFTPTGVVGSNGAEIPADVVVMATGFKANDYFSEIEVIGRDGVAINDIWAKDGPRAYWGVAVRGMPNFFIMYGPNANPINLGPVQYGEWAMKYFLQFFRSMVEKGWKSIEIREEAYNDFNAMLDERLSHLVSVHPRAHKSYFTNEYGRSAVQSPWRSAEACAFFARPDFENYRIKPLSGEEPSAAAA